MSGKQPAAQHVKAGWSTQRLSPAEWSTREAIADALGESAKIPDAHAHDIARGPESKRYDAVISAAPELKKVLS